MYANIGLARIYLTSREAHINGLIGLPQGDNLFKDTVSFNQLVFICADSEKPLRAKSCPIRERDIAPRARIANF